MPSTAAMMRVPLFRRDAHRIRALGKPFANLPMMPRGFLLVLEGIDGAGKSTLAARLAAECTARGIAFVVSREPTDGPYGTALRRSARTGRLPLAEELDLFLKDRAEHVATLIRPALERGEVIILDRYYFSTAAYQGARGANPADIISRNEAFAPKPDLVLLLDLEPASGHGRIARRGGAPDAFEERDYLRRVREIFLSFEQPFLRRIDAGRPLEVVYAECLTHFEDALGRWC